MDSDRGRHALLSDFYFVDFWNDRYFKNWVKGHDNILKITVTHISENLFLTKEFI